MKKELSFALAHLSRLKNTILSSAVTGGPNSEGLALALIGKKSIHFWLDDTVKQKVKIKSLRCIDNRETVWEIKGLLEYADASFAFVMQYDSFRRVGNLEDGRSFTELGLVLD